MHLTYEPIPSVLLPSIIDLASLTDVTRVLAGSSDGGHTFVKSYQEEQILPWRFYYMDLVAFQQRCKKPFLVVFAEELTKVHDFYTLKLDEIERRITHHSDPSRKKKSNIRVQLPDELHRIAADIVCLYRFCRQNYRAIVYVVLSYHEQTPSNKDEQQALRRLLETQPVYDPQLLLRAANAYGKLCRKSEPLAPTPTSSTSSSYFSTRESLRQVPHYFYQNSTGSNVSIANDHSTARLPCKPNLLPPSPAVSDHEESDDNNICGTLNNSAAQTFLLHPDQLMDAMVWIGQHLEPQHAVLQRLTTLYLDSDLMCGYEAQCKREDHVARCVQYSRGEDRQDDLAALETTTFRNGCTTFATQYQWLKPKHVNRWLKDDTSPPPWDAGLNAVLQAEFVRASFADTKEIVHVSVDSDIVLAKPSALQGNALYPYNPSSPSDSVLFPAVAVQVTFSPKLSYAQVVTEHPWLSDLMDLGEPVQHFSLYMHGVDRLHKNQTSPWAYQLEQLDTRSPLHRLFCGTAESTRSLRSKKWKRAQLPRSKDSDRSLSSSSCYSTGDGLSTPTLTMNNTAPTPPSVGDAKEEQTPLLQHHSSYCSFDHPGSSRSDPTQCRSCKPKKVAQAVETLLKKKEQPLILPYHRDDITERESRTVLGGNKRALRLIMVTGIVSLSIAFVFYKVLLFMLSES